MLAQHVTGAASLLKQLAAAQAPATPLPGFEVAWRRIADEESAVTTTHPRDVEDDGSAFGLLYERAATDGELLDEGIQTMLERWRLPEDAVFADLGSGRGGLVLRVAAAARLRHCFGIELIGSKHAAAEAALERVRPCLKAPVTLMQGDLTELGARTRVEDGAAESAEADVATEISGLTHAFACSVCFDDFLLRRMASTLADRTAFPCFQSLISLRSLPSQAELVRIGGLRLPCTWNAGATAHVYVPADLLQRPYGSSAGTARLLARFLCNGGVCTLPTKLQWPRRAQVELPR